MKKRLIGWVRKEAARPLDQSSDVIITVARSIEEERQGSGGKT